MMSGVKRKPIAFAYGEIRRGLEKISNKEDQFMLAVSYANGTRVSEVVGIRASDVEVSKEFVFVITPVFKKRTGIVPHRSPPISRVGEKWLTDILVSYSKGKRGKLISYSKRTAQRRFDEYFGCTSHSFRHTRAAHCLRILGMSMMKIQVYFGLSPKGLTDWITRYGHLDREDLEEHLRKRFEKKEEKK